MVVDGNLQFSEINEEMTGIMRIMGLKSNEARVLVFLMRGAEVTSRDIERNTDLRQPEVSIAITSLMKKGWVQISSLLTENKGRPVKVYSLVYPPDEIIDQIERSIEGDYSHQIELLERVRTLIHSL